MEILTNIKIHQDKELIKRKIDDYKLLQSLVFLISNEFEKYIPLYNNIFIEIINDKKQKNQGCFFVVAGDLYIDINIYQMDLAIKNKLNFKSFKKSLFFNLLHEISHALIFLENYKKYGWKEKIKLENYFDEINTSTGNIIKNIKENFPDSDNIQISRMIPEELECDAFAFKNLSYLENLYDFEGYVI